MRLAISAKVGIKNIEFFDPIAIAKSLLGDSIYANVLLLGAAWQKGLVPLSMTSIKRAIELNNAGVEGNLLAFDLGRWAAVDPDFMQEQNGKFDTLVTQSEGLDVVLADRKLRLKGYQNNQLVVRYESFVEKVKAVDKNLALAVAKGYFKLLAYKDEYEVARLHTKYLKESLSRDFEKFPKVSFYLAPPLLSRKNKNGRIKKKLFGPWFFIILKLLAKAKFIRGTIFDLFSYSAERRNEISLISQYESDFNKFLPFYKISNHDLLEELALLPMDIKGFGHVKQNSIAEVSKKRDKIIDVLREGSFSSLHAAE